jgi:hypothetical protein
MYCATIRKVAGSIPDGVIGSRVKGMCTSNTTASKMLIIY